MNPKKNNNADAYDYLVKALNESIAIKQTFLREYGRNLLEAARTIGACLRAGGKLLIFGNGGSAADAQHMAAEMVGRMLVDREPLAAVALTTDSSVLTAIGNDFGYEYVFVKQLRALARKGDVALAISTSGNSKNVCLGAKEASTLGCGVIGLGGGEGGKLKGLCDIWLCASKGTNSSRIQETHIFAVHSMVDLVDRYYGKEKG